MRLRALKVEACPFSRTTIKINFSAEALSITSFLRHSYESNWAEDKGVKE
jgi:hypothetical protein